MGLTCGGWFCGAGHGTLGDMQWGRPEAQFEDYDAHAGDGGADDDLFVPSRDATGQPPRAADTSWAGTEPPTVHTTRPTTTGGQAADQRDPVAELRRDQSPAAQDTGRPARPARGSTGWFSGHELGRGDRVENTRSVGGILGGAVPNGTEGTVVGVEHGLFDKKFVVEFDNGRREEVKGSDLRYNSGWY